MSLSTKRMIRTSVRALIQDTLKHKWSDTAMDTIISLTMDELYMDFLTANPWFNSTETVVTSASFVFPEGYIPLTFGILNSNRFYKLQKVIRNGQQFEYADPQDALMDFSNGGATVTPVTWTDFTYTVRRNKLQLWPQDATSSVTVIYSFLPVRFIDMTDGTLIDELVWPEGVESVIIYESAARLSLDPARMTALHSIAEKAKDSLMTRIKRPGGGPAVMGTTDDTIMYGD